MGPSSQQRAPRPTLPPSLDANELELAASAILVTDACLEPPGPSIVYANRVFYELTGYGTEEVIGASPRILHGPDTDRAVLDRLRARLARGDGFFGRTWNYRRDGSRFVMEWTVAPIHGSENEVTHFVAMQRDVSAENALAEALRASRDLLERTEAVASVGGWEVDPDTYAVKWTPVAQAIFEVPSDFEPTVDNIIAFYTEDSQERIRAALARAIAEGVGCDLELEIVSGGGRRKWVRVVGDPEMAGGRCVRLSGMVQDITERRVAEERQRATERFLVEISEHVPGFFYQIRYRDDGTVAELPFVSSGIERVCGLPPRQVENDPDLWYRHIHPADQRALIDAPPPLRGEHSWRVEYRMLVGANAAGEQRFVWVEDAATRERDEAGTQVWHGFVMPIGERKALEEQLRMQAHYDALTGLANRTLMRNRLDQELAGASRKNEHVAVLYLDLDDFKAINDEWGHPTGDEVLRQVAQRVEHQFRPYDEVARIGGDEMVVVAGRVTTAAEAGQLAERVLAAFDQPFEAAGHRFDLRVSIGISLYPDDAVDAERLLSYADTALYAAKDDGGARFAFYRSDMPVTPSRRTTPKLTLRDAIERDAVEVAFQPVVDPASEAIVGYEALAHLRTDQGDWQPAETFIDTAESSGAIVGLGERTLEKACAAASNWHDCAADIVVNVSPYQLDQADFVERVQRCQRRAGLEPARVVLQLTERAAERSDRVSIARLRGLRAAGFRVALDDFGAAGASLEVAAEWPLDQITIAARFARAIDQRPERAAVVESIVQMGRRLGWVVGAKSIERTAEARKLHELGCHRLQGHLFGVATA